MDKTLTTIEFDKVLEILSGFAISTPAKKRCLSALPLSNIEDIKLAQTLTSQAQNAYRLSTGDIPIGNLNDISETVNVLKNKIT